MAELTAKDARTIRALAGQQTLAEWITRPTSDTCRMRHLDVPCQVTALALERARLVQAAAPWMAGVVAVKVST